MPTCTCPLDDAQPFGGELEDVFDMTRCRRRSHKIVGWVGSALYVVLALILGAVAIIAVS
jgi:hypothetical protein